MKGKTEIQPHSSWYSWDAQYLKKLEELHKLNVRVSHTLQCTQKWQQILNANSPCVCLGAPRDWRVSSNALRLHELQRGLQVLSASEERVVRGRTQSMQWPPLQDSEMLHGKTAFQKLANMGQQQDRSLQCCKHKLFCHLWKFTAILMFSSASIEMHKSLTHFSLMVCPLCLKGF